MKNLILMAFAICFVSNVYAQTDNITRKRKEIQSNPIIKNQASPQKSQTGGQIENNQGQSFSNTQTNVQKQKVHQEIHSKSFKILGVSFDMMYVKAGTFTMGDDRYTCSKPTHEVTLTKDFYIGKTEVTQALWKAVMGDNPSKFIGDNRPVECVAWYECIKFIAKLNELTGENFRLPTEAEWEFAARGGNNSNNYQYSGSNNLAEVAWYGDNCDHETRNVATKKPNELGIYDMSGNVWEWCFDSLGDLYSSAAQTDPIGTSVNKALRGGSAYWNPETSLLPSHRWNCNTIYHGISCGFRLALSE